MSCLQYIVRVQSLESSQIHLLSLHSVSNELLLVPISNIKTFGDRYFAVWNSLLIVSDTLDLFLGYVRYINSIFYYYCMYQYSVCVLYILLNRPWLRFSGGIGIQCLSMPYLLATRPSKYSEIHTHQWPALNHGGRHHPNCYPVFQTRHFLCFRMFCVIFF